MPKTKKEGLIFGVMMVLIMVYGMICYNIALTTGSLTNITFLEGLYELPLAALVAFLFESLVVSKIIYKKMKQYHLDDTNPIFITAIRACLTVTMMCPFMSLCASIYHNYSGVINIIPTWIETLVKNFPMALCYQLFFVGPLVRFLFGKIVRDRQILKESHD